MITIRDVKAPKETIEQALEQLKGRGFVNYYGLQRFGTSSISTHTIGRALLRGDYSLAADLLLGEREGGKGSKAIYLYRE